MTATIIDRLRTRRGRWLACLGLTVVCATGVAVPSAHAAGHDYDWMLPPAGTCGSAESDPAAPYTAQISATECLINRVRVGNGERWRLIIPPLNHANGLMYAADFKSYDIWRCNDVSHTACGLPMDYRVKQYAPTLTCPWAENLYWGSGSLATPREAVRWWVNSDAGHRENIIDERFKYMGTWFNHYTPSPGVVASAWVLELGSPC